jgi:trehalose-phosphatase
MDLALAPILAAHPGLRDKPGKMVVEVLPHIPWDKGRALDWVLAALPAGRRFPVFIGDDRTDEDAFAALGQRGFGVVVSDEARATHATRRLRDPEEVRELIERLLR